MSAVSNMVTRGFRIALVPTGISYVMRRGLGASNAPIIVVAAQVFRNNTRRRGRK